MKKSDKSDIGRAMQALRKTFAGGGKKPRTVLHDPDAGYCRCIDCRKARGHYPAHLATPPAAPKKSPTKPTAATRTKRTS
jgi:hypothetical protein